MSNDSTERAAIRKRLLANGYAPLPLNGKACYVKGWSFAAIDEDFIKAHERKAAWSNTGLRCDNLIAADIDVANAQLADLVEHVVEHHLGKTEFCRFGKGEKRLLLYWIDDPMPKLRTARYEGDVQVEFLGKGCQFVAYGIHPDTGEPYEWVGDHEPIKSELDALPSVTREQVENCKAALDALFADEMGLQAQAIGGGGAGEHDYCLTADDKFDVTSPGHGLMSVAEIKEKLAPGEVWECNLTAIRPDSDSQAGRIHWGDSGRLSVADFVTGVTYFETLALDEAGELLADILPDEPGDDDNMFGTTAPTALTELLEHYVYVAADDTVRRLEEPTRGIKFANFTKLHYRRISVPSKQRPVLIANAWLEDPACMRCEYATLIPNTTEHVVKIGRARVLNTYQPPVFADTSGEVDTFYDFIDHLLPLEAEADIFLDWLAAKIQRPELRLHAMVMVAPGVFGTGRGTLTLIMERLLGRRYHTQTTLAHLIGQTTQSQYNDWLSGSLIVSVPEALDLSDRRQTLFHARQAAYEHLKTVVETQSRDMLIVRKGVANVTEQVYASLFIATNHGDAFVIPAGDRRLIVLENGERLTDALGDRVYRWMDNPANMGALYAELCERELEYDPMGEPPMTDAKQRMIEGSKSGLDVAWQLFVDHADGDVCTAAQWRQFAQGAKTDYELEYPENPHKRDAGINAMLHQHARRVFPEKPEWQIKMEGAAVRPWIIRDFEKWQRVTGDEIRREISLNGPPGGLVVKLPGGNSG